MHEHLGDIGAVRLVLRQVEDELYSAADALRVLRDEQQAFPAETSFVTRCQKASARSRVKGFMKLTDAPLATQSMSTSASWSICAVLTTSCWRRFMRR